MNEPTPPINKRRRALVNAIHEKAPDSYLLHLEAVKHYAGGVVGSRPPGNPGMAYTSHTEGPYLYDTDGNRFIDCIMGSSALILGHNHPQIQKAVIEQALKGLMYSSSHKLQIEVGEKLKVMLPVNERFVFCNSGTEAVHKAFTLARAHTGRDKIVKFAGTYHGTYEQSILNVRAKPYDSVPIPSDPLVAGVPRRSMDDTLILPMNNESSLAIIEDRGQEIAAVVLELITSYGLVETNKDYLEKLANLCKKQGILLIYDEIITGFRFGNAGAQSIYNIDPDIAVYGKALGGGMPIGMLATRRDILDPCTKGTPPLMMGGTFSGNPMSLAASNAFLRFMRQNPGTLAAIDGNTAYLADSISRHILEKNYPVSVGCNRSLFHLYCMKNRPKTPEDMFQINQKMQDELYLRLRLNGVLINPFGGPNSLSLAHATKVVDALIPLITQSIDELFN